MRLRGLELIIAPVAAILAAASSAWANAPQAGNQQLTAATLSQFLASYEKSLDPVDSAFQNLESIKLPLLDESGHPLERRSITDRRKTISDLRDTAKRLAANPESLVLTLTLFDRTEKLADDLYDLSEIAYDNDEEELGDRLKELLTAVGHNQDSIEGYALDLAAKNEERLGKLESENRELQRKLKEAAEASKAKSPAPK
jgi:anion-transporting  ArsA/GET3 family ATPase